MCSISYVFINVERCWVFYSSNSIEYEAKKPASLSRCRSVLLPTVRRRPLRLESPGRKKNMVVDILKGICTENTFAQDRMQSTSLLNETMGCSARHSSPNASPCIRNTLYKPAAKRKSAEQVHSFFPCSFVSFGYGFDMFACVLQRKKRPKMTQKNRKLQPQMRREAKYA